MDKGSSCFGLHVFNFIKYMFQNIQMYLIPKAMP